MEVCPVQYPLICASTEQRSGQTTPSPTRVDKKCVTGPDPAELMTKREKTVEASLALRSLA